VCVVFLLFGYWFVGANFCSPGRGESGESKKKVTIVIQWSYTLRGSSKITPKMITIEIQFKLKSEFSI
jgi:hypothetical protein